LEENYTNYNLSLELANTIVISNGEEKDKLQTLNDYRSWLSSLEFIDFFEEYKEKEIDELFIKILEVRKIVRSTFIDLNNTGTLSMRSLKDINHLLGSIQVSMQIKLKDDKFEKYLETNSSTSEKLLLELLNSFAETISNNHLYPVKQCACEDCVLFFIDTSKNKKRKWCSMQTCGNRVKASKHFNKKKNLKNI